MSFRKLLLAIALVFAIFETTDIPHTGVPAAVFAVFFYLLAGWFWRRQSLAAAILIGLLCLFEATQAHTWTGVSLTEKVVSTTVGAVGVVAALGVLADRLRNRAALRGARS